MAKPVIAQGVLPWAAKLRNRKLFEDCVILSIGPWHAVDQDFREQYGTAVAQKVNNICSEAAISYQDVMGIVAQGCKGCTREDVQAAFLKASEEAMVQDVTGDGLRIRRRTEVRTGLMAVHSSLYRCSSHY